VAIKSIRKDRIKNEQDMVHIRREIEILSSLNHPHIISIYEGLCLSTNCCFIETVDAVPPELARLH
ncbi:hypothetical protein scyTo_0026294, partial [Scyliorhinus torazame]|nr:hypothetical protein [Scyliorhinus torazame]